MTGISSPLAREVAETWETMAEMEAGSSPDRRATLRECADMVRMLGDRLSAPEQPSATVPTEGHGTGVVGWQLIETAPRDGTRIMLANDTDRDPDAACIGWWIYGEWCDFGDIGCNGQCDYEPTHWMPLPPPPAASVSMGTSRKASEPILAMNAELLEALTDLLALPVAEGALSYLDKGIGVKTKEAAWLRARSVISKATATRNSGDEG